VVKEIRIAFAKNDGSSESAAPIPDAIPQIDSNRILEAD